MNWGHHIFFLSPSKVTRLIRWFDYQNQARKYHWSWLSRWGHSLPRVWLSKELIIKHEKAWLSRFLPCLSQLSNSEDDSPDQTVDKIKIEYHFPFLTINHTPPGLNISNIWFQLGEEHYVTVVEKSNIWIHQVNSWNWKRTVSFPIRL
jgi:hypothetical protein